MTNFFRTLNRGVYFRKAQAAFFTLDSAMPPADHRIDEHEFLGLGRIAFEIDNEKTIWQIDLIGGQPNALVLVHQIEHLADDFFKFRIYPAQRFRFMSQGGVRVIYYLHRA